MKHILVGMILISCVVCPTFAEDQAGTLADREPIWTLAALSNHPPAAPATDRYQLEWQKELLAFQLAYGRELVDLPDPIETGSVTEVE